MSRIGDHLRAAAEALLLGTDERLRQEAERLADEARDTTPPTDTTGDTQ
jgi:hypothetical protein